VILPRKIQPKERRKWPCTTKKGESRRKRKRAVEKEKKKRMILLICATKRSFLDGTKPKNKSRGKKRRSSDRKDERGRLRAH